ncbi:Hypothetical predicted protein [Mytilus galloprovincialis]|uniref:Uncharacterized protein n=1 Tax=Mytilus galloprovincialis TaxID=29158 RepID=A0A8B6G6R8_MYTGA|nr:Hypothetical predicted protein [Mytilus galloprovincialis]
MDDLTEILGSVSESDPENNETEEQQIENKESNAKSGASVAQGKVDMCGNESLATRLRVLTCIEMCSNKLIYDTSKHNRLELVSPSYDEACKAAAKNRAFPSPFLPQRRYQVVQFSQYIQPEMGLLTRQSVS